jgi:hypothetical protein
MTEVIRCHDRPRESDPIKRVATNGFSRDRKARLANLLHDLEPFVSGAGTAILRRLFNEVES